MSLVCPSGVIHIVQNLSEIDAFESFHVSAVLNE